MSSEAAVALEAEAVETSSLSLCLSPFVSCAVVPNALLSAASVSFRDDHGGDPYHGGGYDLPYGGGGGPSYAPPQPWGHPDIHLMQPHHGIPIQARLGNVHDLELGPPAPVMKSFKEFLLSLDDSVDETEAVKRYNDYKLDFRRQQMQDFFLAHKDEEWFRSKYHPDEVGRRKAEAHSALQNRLGVFMYLLENGWLDNISLDIDRAPAIIKILDAAVIKMEGGTENDLRILEQPTEEEEERGGGGAGGAAEPAKREETRGGDSERKPPADKEDKEKKGESGGGSGEEKLKKGGEEEQGEKSSAKEESEPKKLSKKRKRKRSGDSEDEPSASDSDSDSESGSEKPARDEEREDEEEDEEKEEVVVKERKEEKLKDREKEREREREEKKVKEKEVEIPPPRPLHKTCSLFMRSIAPTISKAEIVALCRRYPGFMRVALSEPQPERRLTPCLLSRRLQLPAQNPILKNITDYLIEEVSAEEEELLGSAGGGEPEEGVKEGNPAEITVERDDKLVKVLDRLLLYLRIVHSIDYYNTCEYPSEDEMPNRCGIIHVRGPIPPNRITHGEVAEWQKTFEEKLTPLFNVRESLSEEEAVKMGRKVPEQEVEKFVSANTQELGKDKWLCPLSGKKFKGPEFVRKHIFNKHGEKIEEVKKEVLFFNNFLMDAKRPSLPEIKAPPPPGPGQGVLSPGLPYPHQSPQGLMGYGQPRPPVLGYGGGGPPYPPNQYGGGRGNYDSFRGQGGYPGKPRNNRMIRGDPRAIIEYRDLDAPDDVDFF
nr:PREDICTED: serrate RNA effector molecule homolog [Lepisosteus oculatus]